ncbi:hypothetical protein L1987_50693 [Smallanthus sonchifolius]|uniref:Uncharacterized protein n=1 Tax=Smallanthus sonchifolius TaxID=185202 RepID=A0ACB9ENJ8_9ASTR|nr:hypothetical protein L1987_50693 [Smallanthus sonchifolius]
MIMQNTSLNLPLLHIRHFHLLIFNPKLPPQPPSAAATTTICFRHNHHPQPPSTADTLNLPPKSTLAEKSIKIQDCRFDSDPNLVTMGDKKRD